MDYKDKIRKLLALADSPSEEEAKAALLKAQQLMIAHKISEADLKEPISQEVKKVMTDVTFSKRRDPWMLGMASVIAENYFCQHIERRYNNKQTLTIGFMGLTDDVEICVEIFRYAVQCIRADIAKIKKENKPYGAKIVTIQCNSYGYGFTKGVAVAFERQKAAMKKLSDCTELAVVLPQAVQDAVKAYNRNKFDDTRSVNAVSKETYRQGYTEGLEFRPDIKLGEHL